MAINEPGGLSACEPADPRYGTRARRVRAKRRLGALVTEHVSPPLPPPIPDFWLPGAPEPIDFAWPELRRALRAAARQGPEPYEEELRRLAERAGWTLFTFAAECFGADQLALTALAIRYRLGLTE